MASCTAQRVRCCRARTRWWLCRTRCGTTAPPARCGFGCTRQAPDMARVTHRDVARRAGVSTAVVSYVINNGPRAASAAARARVLRAIEELDYHPNAVARGLRVQRTHTIGFIACDYSPLDVFVSPYSAGVLTGLAESLKDNGYY